MNIRILLIGFVSLMLILAGCGNTNVDNNNGNNQNQGSEVENSNNHEENKNEENSEVDGKFTFGQIAYNLPEEATEMDLGEQVMPIVLYMLEEETGTSINVVEEELPEEMNLTLDEYIEFAVEHGEASGIEYTDSENIELNGKQWNELKGISQGLPLVQRTVIYNNTAYIFTFSSGDQETFNRTIDTFYDVTKSVEELNN